MFYFYVLTFQFQFIIFCQMMKNYIDQFGQPSIYEEERIEKT